MKIEQQVVSFEIAKRLKELGVKQTESYFVWFISHNKEQSFVGERWNEPMSQPQDCAAFTVAELGELLPKEVTKNDMTYYFTQMTDITANYWIIFYRNTMCELKNIEGIANSEADARAKLLISLIENGLIA